MSEQKRRESGARPEVGPQRADVESYNQVVRCAELELVQLLESSHRVKPVFFETKNDKKSSNLSYALQTEQIDFDPETGVAFAMISLTVEAKAGREK